MTPTKQEILTASAGWVAVTLNVVPGLGAGYLYQRRWKAYWITSRCHYLVCPGSGPRARRGGCGGAKKPAHRLGWTGRTFSRNGSRGWLGSEESSCSELNQYVVQQGAGERVWGLSGPCPHVDGPQIFLLVITDTSQRSSKGSCKRGINLKSAASPGSRPSRGRPLRPQM